MPKDPKIITHEEPIIFDWYDGPLLEAARILEDGKPWLIEITTFADKVTGKGAWTKASIRLSREDLQKMIDMLDGKEVKGFFDT